MAINPESCKKELWFLGIALLINEIYLNVEFKIIVSKTFCAMLCRRKLTKGNNFITLQEKVIFKKKKT
jgi:hypothetical protein